MAAKDSGRGRRWGLGGGACATLTPGAPDDSSVARWTLLHVYTYAKMPTHVCLHAYCTHIHNYFHSASTHTILFAFPGS